MVIPYRVTLHPTGKELPLYAAQYPEESISRLPDCCGVTYLVQRYKTTLHFLNNCFEPSCNSVYSSLKDTKYLDPTPHTYTHAFCLSVSYDYLNNPDYFPKVADQLLKFRVPKSHFSHKAVRMQIKTK